MKTLCIVALLAALSMTVGCTHNRPARYSSAPVYRTEVPPPPRYSPPPPVYSTTPPPAYPADNVISTTSDQDLVRSVRHQFDRYGDLSGLLPNIDIFARNGTVTLTGTVPDRKDKDMIDAMVRNTRGVVDVENLLRVTDPGASTLQPTGRSMEGTRMVTDSAGNVYDVHVQSRTAADSALGQRILRELRSESPYSSPPPKVNIHVVNGRITLRGTVHSEAQRQSIAAAVQQAAGPTPVDNELRIRR